MIKKLWCFLWGHDLDKSDFIHFWIDKYSFYSEELKSSHTKEKLDLRVWCKRCQKYKKV